MAPTPDLRAGGAPAPAVLDNAVWAALDGPHAHLAERVGRAARYLPGTYDFAALADPAAADVPEILDLVARSRPGPFLNRTVDMGTYLGIRNEGRLIALAGERLRLPGRTEISAVRTDPGHRGRGLATRLVRAVAAGIRDRGDTPFLHAAADNRRAIRLYESIGFTFRRRSRIVQVRTPGTPGAGRALCVVRGSARRSPTRPAAPDGRR
ncbi:GNAT family N-acetyltransferase [Streptomyces sp. NPDC015139]|uniref:GNAT family N-acetyltransferase n=1 Tax=Streptomyces sp. NPDC015139 TaxID=3364942 RepID=UPI0036FB2438